MKSREPHDHGRIDLRHGSGPALRGAACVGHHHVRHDMAFKLLYDARTLDG